MNALRIEVSEAAKEEEEEEDDDDDESVLEASIYVTGHRILCAMNVSDVYPLGSSVVFRCEAITPGMHRCSALYHPQRGSTAQSSHDE